ncbi:hypothetical protein [Enterovirga sp. CN4-39]|uniref:hypothetical protein n=1 Tax=Enterovirga sp. CN4-39 TaxID=3400910 RepID=UPI003C038DEC
MRFTVIALAAATCIGTALPAAAQSIEVGPRGVGVDLRSPGQRERDWERDQWRRERARERRRWDETGSVRGCREVTVRERNEYGDRVTRTRREC